MKPEILIPLVLFAGFYVVGKALERIGEILAGILLELKKQRRWQQKADADLK